MTSRAEQEDALRDYFDPVYYRSEYPDLDGTIASPLRHFVEVGWREGRNPNRWFDVDYYLRMNLDVAESRVNPLLHYVWAGRREGRQPCRKLDAERRRLLQARPAGIRAAEWAGAADTAPPRDIGLLVAAMQDDDTVPMVVAISHDDYALTYGGVQKLIGIEQRKFTEAGWDFLHLSPAAPLPVLATASRDAFRVVVRLNGERLGVFLAGNLADMIGTMRRSGRRVETVWHHLMGFAPEAASMLTEAGGNPPIFWAHDFYTLCPSYALMRNDVAYCGAPPLDSNACGLCVYGRDRADQANRIETLFARFRPFVLAPSEAAYRVWQRAGLAHAGFAISPLGRLIFDDGGGERRRDGPLRIAHLGARVLFKGWGVFESLALDFAGDGRYAFFQLGIDGHTARIGAVTHVPVQTSADEPDAMIEAVARYRIDVVISWSLWPETFCFAAYEGLAGGASLITHGGAGNVPALAEAIGDGRGLVLGNVDALSTLFRDGLPTRLTAGRRLYGTILGSGGTADTLLRDDWRHA